MNVTVSAPVYLRPSAENAKSPFKFLLPPVRSETSNIVSVPAPAAARRLPLTEPNIESAETPPEIPNGKSKYLGER